MTCYVLEKSMMVVGAARTDEADRATLCVKTGTLVEIGATREDEVGEVKLTLMPATLATEESIGEAGEVG
jgi:hypothetical protein